MMPSRLGIAGNDWPSVSTAAFTSHPISRTPEPGVSAKFT
jgi:hypothetical protein